MRVLVTGASGLLGGAVARTLIARGEEVTVVQRRRAALDCRQLNADLRDTGVVAQVVANQDAVIHLAAKVDIAGRWADYRTVNVDLTATLLASARAARVTRFVQVSSPSVAHSGAALFGVGADPADPAAARGHYARSKAMAERAALAADADGFAVLAIRPHLVWGPGDTQLVERIVQRARGGRLAFVGNGAALVDSTYIDNAAEAIVAGVDRAESAHGRAFVVSDGQPRPISEIVTRLCQAAHVRPPRRHVPFRLAWLAGAAVDGVWSVRSLRAVPPDPPMTRFLSEQLATAHWFDQRETRQALRWTPRVSPDEGFAAVAEHYRRLGTRDVGVVSKHHE